MSHVKNNEYLDTLTAQQEELIDMSESHNSMNWANEFTQDGATLMVEISELYDKINEAYAKLLN